MDVVVQTMAMLLLHHSLQLPHYSDIIYLMRVVSLLSKVLKKAEVLICYSISNDSKSALDHPVLSFVWIQGARIITNSGALPHCEDSLVGICILKFLRK